jgi:hypothetical protein
MFDETEVTAGEVGTEVSQDEALPEQDTETPISNLALEAAEWIHNLGDGGTDAEKYLRDKYRVDDADVQFIQTAESDPFAPSMLTVYLGIFLEKFRRRGC